MADKKALKGLKKGTLHPVTQNTDEAYSVGEKVALPNLQSLSKENNTEDYIIYADDSVYDEGMDYKNTTITVVVADMDLKLQSTLGDGTYVEKDKTLTAKSTDVAKEFCLSYAALTSSGGYRMFRHPVCKLMKVSVSHETKGNSNNIASYELTFSCTARKIDDAYLEVHDSEKSEGFTWLDTVPTLPKAD